MEAFLRPPQVITLPGPEYADDERRFQGIPGIERAGSGRLWATWYGGGITEDRYNCVMLATSADRGDTWSGLKLVIDPDGDGPVRAADPCLWHDPAGRMWLFWLQGYEGQADGRSGVWAMVAEQSDDEDPTWSGPVRMCDGVMLNKPIVLSSGAWLLAVARWYQEGSAGIYRTVDEGSTWSLTGRANIPDGSHRSPDEHMVVERSDGSLWMLVRTKYGIGESSSSDGGSTWSPVAPSGIENPTSRFFVRRLSSGSLLLVKNGPISERYGRSHLTAFRSADEGQTWSGGLLLDERERVSYPDGVQAPDGTVYVIHDRDRHGAKEILMARFTEEDVVQGRCVSEGAALRRCVNKARGRNPEETA